MASQTFQKWSEVNVYYSYKWRVGGKRVLGLFSTRFPTEKCWFSLQFKLQRSMFTCLDIYMPQLTLNCAILLFYVVYYMVFYCISKSCSHLPKGWLIMLHSLLLWVAFQRDHSYIANWRPSPHIVLCFTCIYIILYWFYAP